MEETALLTDDEIVALCVADGRPWPIGLPTVASTVDDLSRAGMRGMRSLMVRRLAGGDADQPGVRPHEMIARDVAAFIDSTKRIGAYLAPTSDHEVLGGASVTAAQTPDGWIVDSVTAAGVHALRSASTDEAAKIIVELAEKTYTGELFDGDPEDGNWVCVVRDDGDEPHDHMVVGRGKVAGRFAGKDIQQWDPGVIRAALS